MGVLASILKLRCPRCRKGRLFKEPFKLGKPLATKESCPKCGQDFEPEVGFYYGAMFLSYVLSSLLLLPFILILIFGFKIPFGWSIFSSILLLMLLYIRIVRTARSLWIHIVVGYNPNWEREPYVKKK